MFRWRINAITFSGGQEIPLEVDSVFILIGPNNSGKSRALSEIQQALANPGAAGAVISAASSVREGEQEDLTLWLQDNYPSRLAPGGALQFLTKGGEVQASQIEGIWQQGDALPALQAFLVHRLGTEERLVIARRARAIDPYQTQPQAYIHMLQVNDNLRRRVSQEVRNAFGTDIVINWGAGPQVGFHVGQEPYRDADRDRVSEPYLAELNRLPQLDVEGDGIRSFVGALLAGLCGAHPVLLIDEPEAFLHPPQARRLAAALARTAVSQRRQVILVTHSADVLIGALEGAQRVSVCRLTRDTREETDVNDASVLPSAQLKELWSRPLLRSSAALNGLFHEGVVVCEGDADCRFYEAILRRMESQGRLDRSADLYFVHGGGKGQLVALARAYRGLNTRTAVVADLDLLRKKDDISSVTSALGADFAEIEGLYNSVASTLSDAPPVTSPKDFLSQVQAILSDAEKRNVPPSGEERRQIQELLDNVASWSQAKRTGVTKLRGGASKDATELLNRLTAIGLFLVPVGELECWWREGPTVKNEWAMYAIRKAEEADSLPEATNFMAGVCRWFGYLPT